MRKISEASKACLQFSIILLLFRSNLEKLIIRKELGAYFLLFKLYSENVYHIKNYFYIFTGIALPPKGIINVPVLFLPEVMASRKTMVIVQMMRANGESWPIDNFDELDAEMKR